MENLILWFLHLYIATICYASDFQPGIRLRLPYSGNELPDVTNGVALGNASFEILESSLGQSEARGLFVRQGCPVDCGGNVCCKAGQDCVPGGCCGKGEIRCGNSKCYDPTISNCCLAAGKVWGCDLPASCCQSPGQCYDSTSYCCADGKTTCPLTDDCVDGGCCPRGMVRCGNTKCYNPKTSVCCTGSGKVWPCDIGDSCCDTPGVCANLEIEQCCPNGSCDLGTTCCANQCCRSGAICGTDGYCSWPISTQPPPSSATTSAAPSQTSKEPEETEEPDEPDLPDQSSTTSDAAAPTTSSCSLLSIRNELAERQREDDGKWGPKYCKVECDEATGQKVYVWEITSKTGQTDELIKSMCAGIQAHNDRRKINDPGFEPVDGEDILTYDGGKTVDPTGNDDRRKETKCGDFCAHLNVGLGRKWEWECDEYPPASMIEGGSLSTRVCIPRDQNSKTQGPMMSRLISACKLSGKSNQKIKVRIVGGCKNVGAPEAYQFPPRLLKRVETTVDLSDSNSTLRDPDADGNLKYVAADFDNLEDGEYNVKITFDGVIERAAIINKYGDEYSSVENPTGDVTFSFTVNDGLNLSAAVIAVTDEAVKLSYSGSVKLATPTQASPPAATTSKGSAPLQHAPHAFNVAGLGRLFLLFILGFFL